MNNRVIFNISILIFTFGLILISLFIYNLHKKNSHHSLEKANIIASIIKNNLDIHQIDKNLKKHDIFLESLSNIEDIKKVWLIRDESINKQYGSHNNNKIDQIDKNVLSNGKTLYQHIDDRSNSTLRIAVPYKTSKTCLQCHHAKDGNTLGVINIILNNEKIKEKNSIDIIAIFAFFFLSLFITILILNKLLKPYMQIFKTLKSKFENALKDGSLTKISIENNTYSIEIYKLVNSYNKLTEQIMSTVSQIDTKLKNFVGGSSTNKITSPLNESNNIIFNLTHLYQFKKEIQLDKTKTEVYNRIAQVFLNKFKIEHLNIIEIHEGIHAVKVHSHGELDFCTNTIISNPENCRVYRSSSYVCSIDFHQACPYFESTKHFYFCIDSEIGKSSKVIFNFIFDEKNKFEQFQNDKPLIEKYIEEMAPNIEVKTLLETLENSALRDGLTGLYNRRFFDEHIKNLAPQAQREGINIGVLMLDMDHFKAVNDEYGHDIGDKVLKEFARVVKENLRDSDIVVRFGGEEFLVLLVGVTSEEAALEVANKLREKVASNVIDVYAGATMQKTISSGLSMFPSDSTSFTTILKYADIALYEAKQNGRNQVRRYKPNKNDELELF